VVSSIAKGKTNRALPLGPSLAIATLGVVLGKVFIERLIGVIAPVLAPVHLP
jgi:hypothetical protein